MKKEERSRFDSRFMILPSYTGSFRMACKKREVGSWPADRLVVAATKFNLPKDQWTSACVSCLYCTHVTGAGGGGGGGGGEWPNKRLEQVVFLESCTIILRVNKTCSS